MKTKYSTLELRTEGWYYYDSKEDKFIHSSDMPKEKEEKKPKLPVWIDITYEGAIFPMWTIRDEEKSLLTSRKVYINEHHAEIAGRQAVIALNTYLFRILSEEQVTQDSITCSFVMQNDEAWGFFAEVTFTGPDPCEAVTFFSENKEAIQELVNTINRHILILHGIRLI